MHTIQCQNYLPKESGAIWLYFLFNMVIPSCIFSHLFLIITFILLPAPPHQLWKTGKVQEQSNGLRGGSGGIF